MHQSHESPVRIPNYHIPPTPGPKRVDDIESDARDRFMGIIWMQKDSSYKLEDYFIEYDHWEEYSETKTYSKRTYQDVYKGVIRKYQNFLCVINCGDKNEYYVIAKQVRSELEQLEPYCQCITCSSCILNPLKYLWCPICTKCIKAGSGFAKEEYIRRAQELKEKTEKSKKIPSKYGKYFERVHWIKITELSMILIVISILFWWIIW